MTREVPLATAMPGNEGTCSFAPVFTRSVVKCRPGPSLLPVESKARPVVTETSPAARRRVILASPSANADWRSRWHLQC